MKKLKLRIGRLTLGCAIALCLTSKLQAQTNLQFTSINTTDEGAIQLYWTSQPSHLYEIDEADSLIDTNTGTITWNTLYDNYPSQGTNTFIGDFGNYNIVPQILNPKYMPMRFYRIVDDGPDSLTNDEPVVSITSPTSGSAATGELTVTVVAATDQPIISNAKLYVDGQEMQIADGTTNWTDGSTNYEMATFNLNTCEWGNKTHTLFATAENQSGRDDLPDSSEISFGHGVSPFVPVLFSNLISRISFSQPSFDPSSGETQQVTAVFAANSDWTLNIVDVNSNVVQSASSSGTSMLYNWDGTSNGTNIPNGIYYYYIYAETNGEAEGEVYGGGSTNGAGSPPLPDFALSDSSELWAMSPDGNDAVPLVLYPPGFDTNDLTIFSATPAQVNTARASVSSASLSSADSGSSFSSDASGGGSSAASQGSSAAPSRPPSNPIKGTGGTFGVANQTYLPNGQTLGPLDNGLNIGLDISMDNFSAGSSLFWGPLPQHVPEGNNFISQMQHWGWKNTINKVDNQLSIYNLEGSGSPYNNVNLGVFIGHGGYGTGSSGIDYAADECKQMYFPINGQYLRLSQMNLGGSGTNGLKWFALKACDSLYQANWSSMQSHGVYPYNSNLHLLLGTDSTSYSDPNILAYWAKYMNYGTNGTPMTIRSAWYQAAHDAYAQYSWPSGTTIIFAAAGDSACVGDTLQTNSAPQGTWTYNSSPVFSN